MAMIAWILCISIEFLSMRQYYRKLESMSVSAVVLTTADEFSQTGKHLPALHRKSYLRKA